MNIGRTLMAFTTLPSTNQFAEVLVSKTRPSHGTVIITDYQTHGKGQNGRNWYGTKGKNIYLSVILFPDIAVHNAFALNAAIALAVREVVESHIGLSNLNVRIKWPNDIYCDARKIGGILVQNTLAGKVLRSSIAGIGLNVNEAEFAADLPNPISLRQITGAIHNKHAIINDLLVAFDHWYSVAVNSRPDDVMKLFTAQLAGLDKEQVFESVANGSKFTGRIRYVDPAGRLAVETHGNLKLFRHGEITQIIDEMQDN